MENEKTSANNTDSHDAGATTNQDAIKEEQQAAVRIKEGDSAGSDAAKNP